MTNTTINRAPDTIHSGDTYTSDPVIDQVDVIEVVEPTTGASTHAATNDFTHVRDARTVVTSGLAFLASGFFVLSVLMTIATVTPLATLLAFGGIAAGLIGVLIGRTRNTSGWNYQLAAYVAVGSAALAAFLIAASYLAI